MIFLCMIVVQMTLFKFHVVFRKNRMGAGCGEKHEE